MSMHHPDSRVGRIVTYYVTDYDIRDIRQRRAAAGSGTANGNEPHEGQGYPAVIVADWNQVSREQFAEWHAKHGVVTSNGREITYEQHVSNTSCNLQLFLDGNDSFWVTSRSEYIEATHDDIKGHFVVS